MADVGVPNAGRAGSSALVRLLAASAAFVVLLVATALYVRVGWWRMESACGADGPDSVRTSVSYGWSWQPLGFRCTYGNGDTETALWF
jgi:hypothetical protein